jgi:4-deoxy-L-threo-5-hexosulose-uronate ketol-isomerase
MEQRYATSPEHVPGMDTAELRDRYLVQDLFVDDEVRAVYTHHDRAVLVGVSPVTTALELGTFPEIRSEYFFAHREGGIVNVGSPGTITVDGTEYKVATGSCLYIGRGARTVVLDSTGATGPQDAARFYLISAPAHTAYPTTLVEAGQGNVRELGDALTSNRRNSTSTSTRAVSRAARSSWGSPRCIPAACGTPCPPTPTTAAPSATSTSTCPTTPASST